MGVVQDKSSMWWCRWAASFFLTAPRSGSRAVSFWNCAVSNRCQNWRTLLPLTSNCNKRVENWQSRSLTWNQITLHSATLSHRAVTFIHLFLTPVHAVQHFALYLLTFHQDIQFVLFFSPNFELIYRGLHLLWKSSLRISRAKFLLSGIGMFASWAAGQGMFESPILFTPQCTWGRASGLCLRRGVKS